MSTVRIKDLVLETQPGDGDTIPLDGAGLGTRALAWGSLKSRLAAEFAAAPVVYSLATLGVDGKIPAQQLPTSIATTLVYKGVVGGGAVPATSGAAGDFYFVTSVGTSQGKTWAVGDMAIYRGSSGQWDQVPEGILGLTGGGTGAMTAAGARGNLDVLSQSEVLGRTVQQGTGGVVFDGTPGASLDVALTGQSIGAADFAVWTRVRVPLVLGGSMGLWCVKDPGTSANRIHAQVESTGQVVVRFYGADGVSYRSRGTLANLLAAYVGQVVDLIFTRSGANLGLSINRAWQAWALDSTSGGGAPSDFSGALASNAVLHYGTIAGGSSSVWTSGFYRAVLFNLAAAGSDIDEVLGTGIPQRLKWGDFNPRYSSDFGAGLDGWSAGLSGVLTTGNVDGVAGQDDWLRSERTGAGAGTLFAQRNSASNQLGTGKTCRVSFTVQNPNGSAYYFSAGWDGYYATTPVLVGAGATTAVTVDYTWRTGNTANSGDLRVGIVDAGGTLLTAVAVGEAFHLRSVSVKALGAVVDLDLNVGKGFFIPDRSRNGLFAQGTTVGWAHKLERSSGEFTVVRVFGHADISATAETTLLFNLPANCGVIDVEMDREVAFDGGVTLRIGPTGANTKYVNDQPVASTGKVLLPPYAGGGMSEGAGSFYPIWIKKSGATTQGRTTVRVRCCIRG